MRNKAILLCGLMLFGCGGDEPSATNTIESGSEMAQGNFLTVRATDETPEKVKLLSEDVQFHVVVAAHTSPAAPNPPLTWYEIDLTLSISDSNGVLVRELTDNTDYTPSCIQCDVHTWEPLWDGTDGNNDLVDPGTYDYEVSMELTAYGQNGRTVQEVTVDDIELNAMDVGVQAAYPTVSVFVEPIEGNNAAAGWPLVMATAKQKADLANTTQGVFVSIDSMQWVQNLLNELNAEGLVALPVCADGDVPFSAFAGLRIGGVTPLPGWSGWPTPPWGTPGPPTNPYTGFEVDIQTDAACDDILPPPNQDGYTDPPQAYENVPFSACSDESLPPGSGKLLCTRDVGWDPFGADPRLIYVSAWEDRIYLYDLHIGDCTELTCPFELRPRRPIYDPSPIEEVQTIDVDCALFEGVCLVDFALYDPWSLAAVNTPEEDPPVTGVDAKCDDGDPNSATGGYGSGNTRCNSLDGGTMCYVGLGSAVCTTRNEDVPDAEDGTTVTYTSRTNNTVMTDQGVEQEGLNEAILAHQILGRGAGATCSSSPVSENPDGTRSTTTSCTVGE